MEENTFELNIFINTFSNLQELLNGINDIY